MLFSWINRYILSPAVPVLLIFAGIVFAVSLRFFHILHIPTVLKSMLSRRDGMLSQRDSKKEGPSPFKSMTVALAGTLGVGNISGVASAIVAGGPGAIFWMWMGALFSMLIKYAEVVLAVKYRIFTKEGFIGGAMYYMRKKSGGPLKILSVPFAILCLLASLSLGNFLQMNAVAEITRQLLPVSPLLLSAVIAVFLYLAISRGFKGISAVTSVLVPLMCAIFVGLSLWVILPNLALIPGILALILREAFHPDAALGGIGGYLLMKSLRLGISRGLITNEAGCGTAPIAHAGADTDSPARQGFWGIFEVFADTILMCSLTAFVVLILWGNFDGQDGMELVISCFRAGIGEFAVILLSLCVIFFALATMIGWSYYGIVSVGYLTDREIAKQGYMLLYSLAAIPGALMSAGTMWLIADLTVGIMTCINTMFLLTRIGEVRDETERIFPPRQRARACERQNQNGGS